MKRDEAFEKQESLLNNLSHLPKKIVSLDGIENTPEFVLHELCHERCFNLSKAAFFVDNPDFDHVKGVAGFDAAAPFAGSDSIWSDPQAFSSHMQQVPFNKQVRSFSTTSIKKNGSLTAESVERIARELGIKNPASHAWEMKYDNHGFLIYEYNGSSLQGMEEHLNNRLYLLSFCPIF